jgi:hypothetical protein
MVCRRCGVRSYPPCLLVFGETKSKRRSCVTLDKACAVLWQPHSVHAYHMSDCASFGRTSHGSEAVQDPQRAQPAVDQLPKSDQPLNGRAHSSRSSMAAVDVQMPVGPPTLWPHCFGGHASFDSMGLGSLSMCAQARQPADDGEQPEPASPSCQMLQPRPSGCSEVPLAPATPTKDCIPHASGDHVSDASSTASDWPMASQDLDLGLLDTLAELDFDLPVDDPPLGSTGDGRVGSRPPSAQSDGAIAAHADSTMPGSTAPHAATALRTHVPHPAGEEPPAASEQQEQYVLVRLDSDGRILRQATPEDVELLNSLLSKQGQQDSSSGASKSTPRGSGRRLSNGVGARKPGGPCCHCGARGVLPLPLCMVLLQSSFSWHA